MLATWRRGQYRPLSVGLADRFRTRWVLFFASGTPFPRSDHEPGEFLVTLLDGITFAGLMFVVASGFTLILRADAHRQHGPRCLVPARGPNIAIDLQQTNGRQNAEPRAEVHRHCLRGPTDARWCWRGRALGVVIQQGSFAEPGQDLRQALSHGRNLGHRGRSVSGPLRWPRPAPDLPRAVTHFFEIFGKTVRDGRVHARRRIACRRSAVAVAQQDTYGLVIRAGV